jgi:RNase P subunit RPR2
MNDIAKKDDISKIYCEKCDTVFYSKKKYEAHYSKHSSGVSCDSCPLDIAVEKIVNLFKRR